MTAPNPTAADVIRDTARRLLEVFDEANPDREIHLADGEDAEDAARTWAADLERRITGWLDEHASRVERGVVI